MLTVETVNVNKFESDWESSLLFSDLNCRAIFKPRTDVIGRINDISRLKKFLKRDIGDEGEDWLMINGNPDRLYMKNFSIFVIWKLRDTLNIDDLFEKLEQHDIQES
jgi:hypothetical protein